VRCFYFFQLSFTVLILLRYDIPAERSVGVDPKKVVRHVHVTQKDISEAMHGNITCPCIYITPSVVVRAGMHRGHVFCAGPVAFVLAALHEDFKKKFHAWLESL
jgi:hypothetical protein